MTHIPVHAENGVEVTGEQAEVESVKENVSFELSSEQKEALELADEIEQMLLENDLLGEEKIQLRGVIDPNIVKIREGNFIESILDSNEGLSTSEIATALKLGVEATNTAARYYKSDSQLRDAYRHFIWNYNGANHAKLGKVNTRIVTVNHEWGLILLDDALDYYDSQYRVYVRLGMIGSDAMAAAFSDTLLNLPKMKKNKIRSYTDFKNVADDANVMDWNNNYNGLYYSYISDVDDAFDMAKPFLILSERKVTSADYRKVYDGGYWK